MTGRLLCRIGLHARPVVAVSDGWQWPVAFRCARCGGSFIDGGPEH